MTFKQHLLYMLLMSSSVMLPVSKLVPLLFVNVASSICNTNLWMFLSLLHEIIA